MTLFYYLIDSIPNDHYRQTNSNKMFEESVKEGFNPNKILDFGCGTGKSHTFFKRQLPESHWMGVDIESSPEVHSRKKDDSHIITYDGYSLPFPNSYFDLVYSHQVLEHVRKPELALQEVARIITSDGLFICQTSQFEPYHSYSLWNFTIYSFKKIIEDSDMKLLKFRPDIDGFTLMGRTYKGRPPEYSKYFNEESPINTKIEEEAREKQIRNSTINYRKLMYAGQFSFVCSLQK